MQETRRNKGLFWFGVFFSTLCLVAQFVHDPVLLPFRVAAGTLLISGVLTGKLTQLLGNTLLDRHFPSEH